MYEKQNIGICRNKWSEIKEVLKDSPSSEMMIEYLSSIGLDISEFKKKYGKEKINDSILYAKDLKDRYSVLWLYYFFEREIR